MDSYDHEVREVTRYVESQADGETVTRAEKLSEQTVLGERYEIWDVHTDASRYWVITNLLNLYVQDDWPSADAALSLHIGLMLRIHDRQRREPATDSEEDRFARTWRRFNAAVDAFNGANEAEDFQSVGAHCRQCLITLAKELDGGRFLDDNETAPKGADFTSWAAVTARAVTSSGRVRAFLVGAATTTWDLAARLVHFEDASAPDAEMVLDATRHVVHMFGTALLRYEVGPPTRCPECDSYRVVTDYRPDLDDPPYMIVCEACGWEVKAEPWCEGGKKKAERDGIDAIDTGPDDGRPGTWSPVRH